MSVLSVHNLIYCYSKGTPFQTGALKDFSFDFQQGEIVGIIGHTGSGKSTLLQCLNGLLKPEAGSVLLNGENIHSSKKALRECKFKVGLCFQYPEYQLFGATVFDDIAFGPKNMGLSEEEIKIRVKKSVDFVGIPEAYLQKSPFDLSGGEKRKVAIAGIISMEPEVLILDEPTAGLDPKGKKALIEMIKAYNKETGSTVIFVSHCMDDVALIADRVIVMSDGRAVLSGTVEEVYSDNKTLLELGLDVPEITKIIYLLKEKGYTLPETIFTVEKAARVLSDIILRGGNVFDK